jgi:hypothetical protein
MHFLPFFKRFRKKMLLSENYFNDMKMAIFKEKDVFAMDDDDYVYVLINGKVTMREHSTIDPVKMIIKQVCKPGYVLGVSALDQGISNLPYIWGSVTSKQAEFIKIKRSTFETMWYACPLNTKEVMISTL